MATHATTTQRGYGYAHQRQRKRAERKVRAGLAYCWRCLAEGRSEAEAWIGPDDDWDLGHDDQDRTVYRGPEHRHCNRATASRRPTRQRPQAEQHPGLVDGEG